MEIRDMEGDEEDKVVLETVNEEEEEEEGKRNREPPIVAFMVWFGCAYCLVVLYFSFCSLPPSFLPSFPGERTHITR